jgi:calcineurin-like phosphoesterase family protein
LEDFNLWDTDPWIISDTHFFHQKIKEYADRPENWQSLIIQNWNDKIKYGDLVLHLGDFSLATREQNTFLAEILNGQVYLLHGNHDHTKESYYARLGITLLKPDKFYLKYKNILFSHRPIKVLPNFHYNLHGHIHQLNSFDEWHINCSVEKMDYQPIRLSELIEKYEIKLVG